MRDIVTLDINTGDMTKVTYNFYFLDGVIYLDSYHKWEKPTKRSGYKNKGFYDRLRERDSDIKESEVPFHEEIKKQALEEFTSRITVKKWSERGK